MKKPLANKIASALSDSVSEMDSAVYETITLRPAEDVSAMITAINEVLRQQQPVLTMFVDEISEKLCELLLDSKGNQSLVQEVFNEPLQSGSALSLLMTRGAFLNGFKTLVPGSEDKR